MKNIHEAKPVIVDAAQQKGSGEINTNLPPRDIAEGSPATETYKMGDWIVTTPNGVSRVWPDEKFQEHYVRSLAPFM